MLKKFLLAAAALTASTTALPAAAEAHGYRDYDSRYSRHYDGYRRDRGYDRGYYGRSRYGSRDRYYGRGRCGSGTTGAIVGGAAGALLGREVARGGRGYYRRGGNGTVGALIGGAAGALIGREIGRSC